MGSNPARDALALLSSVSQAVNAQKGQLLDKNQPKESPNEASRNRDK